VLLAGCEVELQHGIAEPGPGEHDRRVLGDWYSRAGSELHVISIAPARAAAGELLVTFLTNRWPSHASDQPAAGAFRARTVRLNGGDYMELERLSGFADRKTGGGWRRLVVRYDFAADGSACFGFMNPAAVRAAFATRELEGREIGGREIPERRVLISSSRPKLRAIIAQRGKELFAECAARGEERWKRLP
jgi:hypothetical protein